MYVCVCSYISVCACVHVEIIGLWDILYSKLCHTKDKEEKLTDVKKKDKTTFTDELKVSSAGPPLTTQQGWIIKLKIKGC